MDFDQSMILDATRGSIARFVNHSCSPNCRMVKWTVLGKPRMALFAGDQGIMTGEELTYDYNFNPYSIKNVQECFCGAENCRGVLGPKPKDIKDALNPIVGGGKRKLQQAMEDAVEGVKQVAKKRKLNVPVPKSVKNAVGKAKNALIGAKTNPEPQIRKESKTQPKKSNKKRLPLGWVYVDEIDDPPPPKVRNIFQNDPEKLMKDKKRSIRIEEEEFEAPAKQVKTEGTASKSPQAKRSRFSEDMENEEEEDLAASKQKDKKMKGASIRKNVVRTIKGRHGAGKSAAGKSIRVIGSP